MGMIRVSDDAEAKIKAMANGRTIGATVDSLVAGAGTSDDIQEWMQDMFDHTIESLGEQIDELKKMIEDTTVDRVDKMGQSGGRVNLPWDLVRELFYDVLEYDAPEWWAKDVVSAVKDSPDGVENHEFCVEDNFIVSPFTGGRIVWARISPRIKKFLKDHGVMI